MNRFKATMLCSGALARSGLIGLVILQIIMAVVIRIISAKVIYHMDSAVVSIGCDLVVVAYLLVFGILFYGRHTAFCISNAVSRNYRVSSYLTVIGVMTLLAALLNMAVCAFPDVDYTLSFAELYRFFVIGGGIWDHSIAATLAENIFYYFSVAAFGSLLGSLREAKGDGFTLLLLLGTAVVLVGFAWLGNYTATPAAWLCLLPAMMLRSRWTAMLLYGIAAAVLLFGTYHFTFGVNDSKRGNQHEEA